jgi:hypothetical protein
LKSSIEKFGFNYSLPFTHQIHVYTHNGINYLVNGHHRLAVAQRLGIQNLNALVIDAEYLLLKYGVTPEQLAKLSQEANSIGNKIRWYK